MGEFTKKNIFKGSTIVLLQIFNILTDTSSWPWALFISKDIIVFRISLPEIVIDLREEAVRDDLSGSTELFTTREHCKLKKSLKLLALSFKSETYLLPFTIGGIKETFLQL